MSYLSFIPHLLLYSVAYIFSEILEISLSFGVSYRRIFSFLLYPG